MLIERIELWLQHVVRAFKFEAEPVGFKLRFVCREGLYFDAGTAALPCRQEFVTGSRYFTFTPSPLLLTKDWTTEQRHIK